MSIAVGDKFRVGGGVAECVHREDAPNGPWVRFSFKIAAKGSRTASMLVSEAAEMVAAGKWVPELTPAEPAASPS